MMVRMEPSATEPIAQSPLTAPSALKRGLDDAATKLCIQFVQQLRHGLAQALLYTEGTKQFERACTNTYSALSALLDAIGNFKFGIAKTDFLINGERTESPPNLRGHIEYIDKIMSAAGTAGLKFEKGLEEREVGPFLQLLARKKIPATDGEKVNLFLRENGITHLQIDELRYVALSKEEKVYTGDGPVPGTHAVAQKALSELVDATLSSIEKVADDEARVQLRAELTDQLIEKSDAMFENVLATASQRIKLSCTASQAALMAVPSRDGKLLEDTLALGRMILNKGVSDDDESVKRIRAIIEQIVSPYHSHAEDILSKAPVDKDNLKLLPEWFVSAHASLQGGSAADRVAGILCQSPCALLDEQMFAQIVDVLDELTVAAMDQEAEQLAAHMAGALHTPTKKERIKAVERLSFLLERSLEQSSNAVRIVEDGLLAACTHETCDEVMKLLLDHLGKRCVHHYGLGNHQRAAEYVEWIVGLEQSSRSALKDEGANLARQAREQLAKSEFSATLSSDILDQSEKGAIARRMAQSLGPETWSALFQRIRVETDPELSAALAAQIKQLGPQAVQLYFDALGKESDPAAALRMLNLAPSIGDDTAMWGQIQPLLRHADGAVCGGALAFVLNHDGEQGMSVLCQVLSDEKDPERRKVWISSLARMKHLPAQQVLLDELNDAVNVENPDEELVIAIMEGLSSAGNAGVVRPIAAMASRATPPSKTVIVAAFKALAPFYTDPLAKETLERARKDKDPEIARLALVCLRGIVAADQQHAADSVPAETAPAAAAEPDPQPKRGRKTRRGFEALAAQQVDDIFQVGVALGAGAPAAEEAPEPVMAPAASAKPKRDEPFINDLKPTLEGRVQDLGLATTIRIVGGKDGLLRIYMPESDGSLPEGRIYIRGKKILDVTYADMTAMRALKTIEQLQGAYFAYYPASFKSEARLDIEIDKVAVTLRHYKDEPEPDVYAD